MSGDGEAESVRELIERAALQNRRASRLSMAVYAGFFGAFALGSIGSFFYSLSRGISWGFLVAGVGSLAASIFYAALNSRQHKKCAVTSRAMIELTRTQNDSNAMTPLHEGEFVGPYEVLCCDESMVMMSRNRSHLSSVAIRVVLLVISISAFGVLATVVFHSGTKIFLHPHHVILLFGVPGLVALLFAVRRLPVRWYASREEMIIRIESVRWIFVREIEDVQIEQIEAVYLDQHTTVVQSTDGKIRLLQEITIPQLVGLKLSKDEQAAAEESIRQLQHTRILKSLDRVFPKSSITADPEPV